MNLLRPLILAVTLVGGSAFAHHHHHHHHHSSSHHSSSSHHNSGGDSPDVCLRWEDVPVDAGAEPEADAGAEVATDAGVELATDAGPSLAEQHGVLDEDSLELNGGLGDPDESLEESDAGTVRPAGTVRVCVERVALGCSASGPVSGGLLALMAVLARRRKA